VKNENTNKLDSGEKLNSCKDTVKKQEIGLGNFIVLLDMMPHSYDKTRTVQTEANSLSSTISRHRRPVETTTLSLLRGGEKRKSVLTEDSDKIIKKVPNKDQL